MARFTLTIVVDDDEVETIDDVNDTIARAWADENTARVVTFSGRRPDGAELGLFLRADPDTYGVRLDRATPKPKGGGQ